MVAQPGGICERRAWTQGINAKASCPASPTLVRQLCVQRQVFRQAAAGR